MEWVTNFFNTEFWRASAATSFGAVLALFIAITGLWWQARGARTELKSRRKQLASGLKLAVEQGLRAAKELEKMSEDKTLVVAFDLALLQSTASLKYELLRDTDLNEDIDSLRGSLELLASLESVRLSMEFSAYRGLDIYEGQSRRVEESLKSTACSILKIAENKQIVRRLKDIADEKESVRPSLGVRRWRWRSPPE